jgi:hypothetical protein
MTTVAEILRDCAYGLPCEEDSEVALLDGVEMVRTGSPFICDHLDRMAEMPEVQAVVADARIFLRELGMNSGMAEFLITDEDRGNEGLGIDYTIEHQTLRAWWLLFAADLAEEWGV